MSGLAHITPKAVLSLISHPEFSHLYKNTAEEKLCSVQEYLKGTLPLRKILEVFFRDGFLEEKLLESFDQEDFEDITLFLWLTFDNDAHIDNFLAYPKRSTPKGDVVYGILKIDNSLALPEENSGFSNALMYLPHALLPISSKIREKLQSLPLDRMGKIIEKFGLSSSLSAFEKRLATVQNLLLESKDITYYECSLRLGLLENQQNSSE